MKRWLLWGGLLLSLVLGGCASETATENGKQVLTVGMDPAIGFPFIYKVENSEKLGGFEYDIAEYVAHKLGQELKVVEVRWENLLEEVAAKNISLALNAIEKPSDAERKKLAKDLAFTEQYYSAFQQLVILNKDNFTYNLSDLKGQKVGVLHPSVAEVLLQELNKQKKQAKLQIQTFETAEALFLALKAGKVKATLTERALASWYRWKFKELKLTGEPITPEIPYVGAIHAEEKELLKKINKILIDARKDKVFQAIFSKWHVSVKR